MDHLSPGGVWNRETRNSDHLPCQLETKCCGNKQTARVGFMRWWNNPVVLDWKIRVKICGKMSMKTCSKRKQSIEFGKLRMYRNSFNYSKNLEVTQITSYSKFITYETIYYIQHIIIHRIVWYNLLKYPCNCVHCAHGEFQSNCPKTN